MKKIRKWFYNHYKSVQKECFKFTRKWSARNAYFYENCALVLAQTTESSGLSGRQPRFTGAFQIELSRLWKGISMEDQQHYKALAESWSAQRPPEEVQMR